jgi:Ger(x)C family germination protein
MIAKRGIITIIISTLVLCLLTGCWGSRPVDHIYYAQSLGFDYKEGQYIVYLQILNFSYVAGSEMAVKGKEAPMAKVGQGHGKTVTEAMNDTLMNAQRSVYWGHVNTIVMTEALMKHGVGDLLDLLARYKEFRYTPWIYLVKDPVEKVFLTLPVLAETPAFSLLTDPEDNYEQQATVEPVRLHRFKREWNEPAQFAIIPFVSLIKEAWTTDKGIEETVEINSFGIMQGKEYKGSLKGKAIQGLRWLQEGTKQAITMVPASDEPPLASVMLENSNKNIDIYYKDGKPQFTIRVTLIGNVLELLDKQTTLAEIEKITASTVKEQIEKTVEAAIKKNADIMQLSLALYRKNPRVWREHTTHGALDKKVLKEATIIVSVKLESALGLKMEP